MSKKKNAAKKFESPTDYHHDFLEWPRDWMESEKDLKIGKDMLNSFTPFIKSLIDDGLAAKTIKNHMANLCLLGSEIIRRLNDGDAAYRKLPTNRIVLEYIDDQHGPLLSFWDPNDSTELAYLKAFDATCRKLYKFISPPF